MYDKEVHIHAQPKRDPSQRVSYDKPNLLSQELQYPILTHLLRPPALEVVCFRGKCDKK